MRPHLLMLIALLGTVCFSHSLTADDKVKAPEPAGSIQAVVKGTLVCKKIGKAYISVIDKNNNETRVWFWESEGAWKSLRDSLPKLDGQEVTVRGRIHQLAESSQTSIPDQALYF